MKLKIKQWQGYQVDRLYETWIDTDNYPELKDMTPEQVSKYLTENKDNLWDIDGDETETIAELLEENFVLEDYAGGDTIYGDVEVEEAKKSG